VLNENLLCYLSSLLFCDMISLYIFWFCI